MTKVFLSWSGPIALDLARAFKSAIEIPFNTKCFLSSEIPTGTKWPEELDVALNDCSFAILFLTPASMRSDWMLWEAGMLWKRYKRANRICPLLIGLDHEDTPDPLKVYQQVGLPRRHAGESDEEYGAQLRANCEPLFKSLDETIREADHRSHDDLFVQRFTLAWSTLREPIVDAVTRSSQRSSDRDQIAVLTERLQRREHRERMLMDAMEGPAYFMDEDYTIRNVNNAASTFFKIPPGRQTIPINDFLAHVEPYLVDVENVRAHFEETFSDPRRAPDLDFEVIDYRHPRYGLIRIRKVGAALPGRLPDNRARGWVVVFNLESVEKSEEYYSDHTVAVTAALGNTIRTHGARSTGGSVPGAAPPPKGRSAER